jgi:hypothetical protein
MAMKPMLTMPVPRDPDPNSPKDSVRARVRLRRDGSPWSYDPPRKKGGIDAPVKLNPLALVEVPTDPVAQTNLASQLLVWSETPEAESIEQFPLSLRMNPYKFYRIADINPYFSDCLDAAMAAIGFRREKNARTRVEDSGTIMKMQPLYNKSYRELALMKANAESTKVGTMIQVIEGPVPDSDMVPKKLESDNK